MIRISIVDVASTACSNVSIDTPCALSIESRRVRKKVISLRGDLQYEPVVFARDDRKRFREKGLWEGCVVIANL